ncbi:cell envelope integrity protein CreD [Flavobacterium aquatile]|uniref:Membrane protein n=1 Tax=Flavobacterium aquatile LMG 4008 = ATCC 11947 TaxID=1453498 RepID=A0A095V1I6_9FLAO|nr:cell envelope integrity protein CreD [Flavobacterium aquatile]KGD68700.1 membrane protein [Flavobacterium aquatile LMG 4008 = ATCC 11947]OXA66359.1 inner membrane protein [Flavobacterium aquatile] [Flavobacterium aquatile LMG 4008 = ATCC 11947]GEC79488.1 cell envelope integrity protein CreD [Flavobacterium aquatile]
MENLESETKGFFQSTTAKMIMVGLLTLILLIPLTLIQDLIAERSIRQKEVIAETISKWGESVYFYGPILKIPYKDPITSQVQNAYFFPEKLSNVTNTEMKSPLQRSIYKSNVFTTKMEFSGNYTEPNFAKKSIPTENVFWDKATIVIRTTNLKSINDEVKIKIGNTNYTFEPNHGNQSNDSIELLETGFIDYNSIKNANFNMNITYNGSKSISIVPIGKTTDAKMTSNWNSPSFNGSFIPNDKKISNTGFNANWKILHFNRPFAQENFETLPKLNKYAFAVDFITPVDEYQQNERASKYGFLVIGLTFLIFFLIQSISKISIHIFQYSMIGIALIMFYTLLISITEHSSFSLAYAIAGTSVVVLIALYSISILKDRKFPLFIGVSLSVLYTFIYVIIQLEDYALLVGSIGLFCILAAVMYFSRKIEWSK